MKDVGEYRRSQQQGLLQHHQHQQEEQEEGEEGEVQGSKND